ncbi:MAG: hypothetical protein K0Q90_1118 [Paenibacillaceae bacterium]|jgi:hypothetical protein|nr:hypothetical protein [Paenibacillaceae bacterium]
MKLVKSKGKTAVIAAAAALALLAAGTDFAYGHEGHTHSKDYSGHWSEQLVASAIREGLLQGYENGAYCPDLAITRAELAVLLARALPLNAVAAPAAALPGDVADGSWYAQAVRQTLAAGLLTADDEGRFRPGATVTRQDGAAVLSRLLDWSGESNSWLDQAAAGGYIQTSSDGYVLPYLSWSRSEALYALLKTKGAAPEGIRPAAFTAVQQLKGVIRDTGTGFTLTAAPASKDTVTQAVYSLSGGKSLAGTKAAAGTDGLEVSITGVSGVVPASDRLIINSISLPAAAAGPDTLEGFLLEGHHSSTASPSEHKKLCLLMPDCAASGFGVSVLQSDGTYKYFKFDETGHRLAVILLDSITAADHVGIRVEGHIAGDVVHVSRLSRADGLELEQAAAEDSGGSTEKSGHAGDAAEGHGHDAAGEHGHSAGEHGHGAE